MSSPVLKKLNFIVEEDIRKEMESLVPAGQRARLINEALRKELLRIKRERIHVKLSELRTKSSRVSDREIVATLHSDRKRA
jgi:hypothetical protein